MTLMTLIFNETVLDLVESSSKKAKMGTRAFSSETVWLDKVELNLISDGKQMRFVSLVNCGRQAGGAAGGEAGGLRFLPKHESREKRIESKRLSFISLLSNTAVRVHTVLTGRPKKKQ